MNEENQDVIRLPRGAERAERLRRMRPGHAIGDDGSDAGPELCGGCLRPMIPPNVAWCDDCERGVCLACHGPVVPMSIGAGDQKQSSDDPDVSTVLLADGTIELVPF